MRRQGEKIREIRDQTETKNIKIGLSPNTSIITPHGIGLNQIKELVPRINKHNPTIWCL